MALAAFKSDNIKVAPPLSLARQAGLTLVELMITMLIGLVAIGAAGTLFLTTIQGNNTVIQATRLNSDIEGLLTLMANDIRRAGYWSEATPPADATLNPFTQTDTNLLIFVDGYQGNDCVLYTYDANDSDTSDDDRPDLDEFFGFRVETDGSVSMRTGVADLDGDVELCTYGTWQRLTLNDSRESYIITDLQINDLSKCMNASDGDKGAPFENRTCTDSDAGISPDSGDALVVRRVIGITITAESSADSDIQVSLSTSIALGNDRLYEGS